MWICNNCGNMDRFEGIVDYTVTSKQRRNCFFDNEGSIEEDLDIIEEDEIDSSWDNDEVERCHKCNSCNIDWLEDDEELEDWKKKHFKNGVFSKTEITEEPDENGNLW